MANLVKESRANLIQTSLIRKGDAFHPPLGHMSEMERSDYYRGNTERAALHAWVNELSKYKYDAFGTVTFVTPRMTVEECEVVAKNIGKTLGLKRAFWVFEYAEDKKLGFHCHVLMIFKEGHGRDEFLNCAGKYGNSCCDEIDDDVSNVRIIEYITKKLADSAWFYRFPYSPERWLVPCDSPIENDDMAMSSPSQDNSIFPDAGESSSSKAYAKLRNTGSIPYSVDEFSKTGELATEEDRVGGIKLFDENDMNCAYLQPGDDG